MCVCALKYLVDQWKLFFRLFQIVVWRPFSFWFFSLLALFSHLRAYSHVPIERQQIDTYFLFAIGNRCLISHSIEAFFNDKCSRTSMYSWISNWDQNVTQMPSVYHCRLRNIHFMGKSVSVNPTSRVTQERSLLLSSSCTNNMQLDLTAIADYKSQLSHHQDEWTTDG